MSMDTRWEDARRLEAWAGEVRVNLVRLAALIVFYGHHLVNVYLVGDESAGGSYHVAVTALVFAWSVEVLVLYFGLAQRWLPPSLKYAATVWDLLLISALLMVNPDGPRSPLVLLYFLVIAAAPLRLSLGLVYAASLGAMAAYVIVLGQFAFIRVGAESYYQGNLRVPRSTQIITLLALGAAGLLAGQVVRQVRRIAAGNPVAVVEANEG
jgi:hypothetical protein